MERIDRIVQSCPRRDLRPVLETALRASLEGGAILRRLFGRPIGIRHKGEIDLVTEADIASEDRILEILGESMPGVPILSEETSREQIPGGDSWIVDPLDGTTNFAHGFPWFAVSIAFGQETGIDAGVVYAPLQEEIYHAVRGCGAWLNGARIQVSRIAELDAALLGTGFPYDVRSSHELIMAAFGAVIKKAQGIRRAGAAAMDLASVAAGRLDGFWEVKLKPWDTAAGLLLVEEADGMVTDFASGPYNPFLKEILATNRLIHRELSEILQGFRP